MSSVAEIVEAGRAAGVGSGSVAPGLQTARLTALVAIVQTDSGGDAASVPGHAPLANRYPTGWGIGDWTRYGARIPLVAPAVTRAMAAVGAGVATGVVTDLAEPIVAVAQEPLRLLAWATDPGTILRVIKMVIGSAMIIGALTILARPVATQIVPAAKVAKAVKGLR